MRLYRQTFFIYLCTQGGTFKVTQELIAFVGTFVQQDYNEMVLLDVNENPNQD